MAEAATSIETNPDSVPGNKIGKMPQKKDISTLTEASSPTQGPGPARFTRLEKEILYGLFQQHEAIIDIKYRKQLLHNKARIVRECWEEIAETYNNHPQTTTRRKLKQIQKFWLNARLRKQYPSILEASTKSESQQQQIKKPELHIGPTKEETRTPQHSAEESDEYDNEIPSSVGDPESSQQFCMRQISANKLHLTDLLDFKINLSKEHDVAVENEAESQEQEEPRSNAQNIQDTNPVHPCCNHCPNNTIDNQLNFYRVREAELRCKGEELKLEQQKFELAKAKIEFKQSKELHRLKVREMQMKIRMLAKQGIGKNINK